VLSIMPGGMMINLLLFSVSFLVVWGTLRLYDFARRASRTDNGERQRSRSRDQSRTTSLRAGRGHRGVHDTGEHPASYH
jgi:hypothetical protein